MLAPLTDGLPARQQQKLSDILRQAQGNRQPAYEIASTESSCRLKTLSLAMASSDKRPSFRASPVLQRCPESPSPHCGILVDDIASRQLQEAGHIDDRGTQLVHSKNHSEWACGVSPVRINAKTPTKASSTAQLTSPVEPPLLSANDTSVRKARAKRRSSSPPPRTRTLRTSACRRTRSQ